MKHANKNFSPAQRAKRAALIRRIVNIALTASIVLFLAVFFAFVPFRIMLPAYKIPPRGENELRLHFLDLKGGVTIAEFPDGEVLVINAGDGSFESDNRLCRYLRGLDISSFSVLATSCASNHIGGMPALFETFSIKKVYLPAFESNAGTYQRFASAIEKEGCEKQSIVRYNTIENKSGAYAVCISPYSREEEEVGIEDASVTLYLSYAGVNALLTGDLTQKREQKLIKEYEIMNTIFERGEHRVRLEETNILLAPSHASNAGCSSEWLSLLSPNATVICSNKQENPADDALACIIANSTAVYRTDELGAVMITVKNGEFFVTTHVA